MDTATGYGPGVVGGMAGGSALNAPKAVNPSCFGNIEDVVGTCSNAAGRVEKLVARLVGDPPPSPEAAGLQPGAHGLLNIADLHARDIRDSMKRIFDAVERLESQLP